MKIRVGVGGFELRGLAQRLLPQGPAAAQRARIREPQTHLDRDRQHLLRSKKPESFIRWRDATPDDFVFSVKGTRFATNRRVLAEAAPSIERFFKSGVTELKQKLGPVNWQFAPTKRFDPDDFGAFLKLLPRSVDGLTIRHAVEVRNASFRVPEFIALAREHGVGVVIAGDSKYPQIADVTAPFVYARIMGTTDSEDAGYPAKALDLWAKRAEAWASGGAPPDLETLAPHPKASARDVFLYVISGFKVRNPLAAMALIERAG